MKRRLLLSNAVKRICVLFLFITIVPRSMLRLAFRIADNLSDEKIDTPRAWPIK